MLRSLAAVLVVALLGAGAAGAYWQFVAAPEREADPARAKGPAAVTVEAGPVRIGPATSYAEAVGTILSNESVLLSPEVSGRLVRVNFAEGQDVAAGTVLAELDNAVERASLDKAKATLQLAQQNFERARDLRRVNAGTERALDEAEAARLTAVAEVDLAQAALDKRILRAPFDGRVGLRRVSPGEYVTSGSPIVNLEQIDPLKVDFRVPELFLPSLRAGQPIAVAIDAFAGRSFAGEVLAINPLLDEAGRAVVVRAKLENDRKDLRPGLFARVQLALAERQDAVFVPESALVPQGGRQWVFKVADDGKGGPVARLTEVTLGRRVTGEIEIAGGLAAGDVVVSAGGAKLRDGSALRVVAPSGPAAADAGPASAAGGGAS